MYEPRLLCVAADCEVLETMRAGENHGGSEGAAPGELDRGVDLDNRVEGHGLDGAAQHVTGLRSPFLVGVLGSDFIEIGGMVGWDRGEAKELGVASK